MKDDLLKKAQEEYLHGRQAEDLLNNPAFQRNHDAVMQKAFYDLINTKWYQKKVREEIYRRLKGESLFRQSLEAEVQNGKLAEKRLEAK